MRIFLSVLILIFSFQSSTKADDIRDFEIEGMSIGDSALDHFTKQEIEKNIRGYFNNQYKLPSDLTTINNVKHCIKNIFAHDPLVAY